MSNIIDSSSIKDQSTVSPPKEKSSEIMVHVVPLTTVPPQSSKKKKKKSSSKKEKSSQIDCVVDSLKGTVPETDVVPDVDTSLAHENMEDKTIP
ncbi:hypothetical protein A2U01_0014078 [Trifolium medium]|uniref:Uncharacterized protein n=1 Tax=Trifolium medium TaxID=97028 RepID=A0A392N007_9FABA|nr:hypothetical protein [Trifolium medium]